MLRLVQQADYSLTALYSGCLLLEELVPHREEGDGQAGPEEDDEVGSQLEPAAEISIKGCRRKGWLAL